VKTKNKHTTKQPVNQGKEATVRTPAKIDADTEYEVSKARMTAYGGLLALMKFLDLVEFKEAFDKNYCSPTRKPALGCYRMILGLIGLLFVGFARIGHFYYLRDDEMLCGWFGVPRLPVVSTYWRYLFSLTRGQSLSLLKLSGVVRSRVWEISRQEHRRITIHIDTTVSTVYGKTEGARKGHNPKRRGKKALRPVMMFIEETGEYLLGSQRRGVTMSDREVAGLIRQVRRYLPACVRKVLILGDAEFIGPETVQACEACRFDYILANKSAKPHFGEKGWYRKGEYHYNEGQYAPQGWDKARRFVVMRIREDQKGERQLTLFEMGYQYRCFVTNLPGKAHRVVTRYDQRANVEGRIKEAQQEGILAIPSRRFWSNHAYFQVVMLTYNLWRWMQMVQRCQRQSEEESRPKEDCTPVATEVDHTIRIARLKMLFVSARITKSHRQTVVKYSIHDARAAGLLDFMEYLDRRRKEKRTWSLEVPINREKKTA
jgi:hypothetical protein